MADLNVNANAAHFDYVGSISVEELLGAALRQRAAAFGNGHTFSISPPVEPRRADVAVTLAEDRKLPVAGYSYVASIAAPPDGCDDDLLRCRRQRIATAAD